MLKKRGAQQKSDGLQSVAFHEENQFFLYLFTSSVASADLIFLTDGSFESLFPLMRLSDVASLFNGEFSDLFFVESASDDASFGTALSEVLSGIRVFPSLFSLALTGFFPVSVVASFVSLISVVASLDDFELSAIVVEVVELSATVVVVVEESSATVVVVVEELSATVVDVVALIFLTGFFERR